MIKVTQSLLNKQFFALQTLNSTGRKISKTVAESSVSNESIKKDNIYEKMLEVKRLYSFCSLQKFVAVFFPHQIFIDRYKDISSVIRGLMPLQRKGQTICIHLPSCSPSTAFVLTKDLLEWCKKHCSSSYLKIKKFIKSVVPRLRGYRVTKVELSDRMLTESDISFLVKSGFLVYVGDSNYEVTVPFAGQYSKLFNEGRNIIISTLKKSADQELLMTELLQKNHVLNRTFFGLSYHIADLERLNAVESVETNAGTLIRFAQL